VNEADVTRALDSITALTMRAAQRAELRNEALNRLATILNDVRSLRRVKPAAVNIDLVAQLCVAANSLGVEIPGAKR
jgi:hypothetical protein